MPQAKQGDTVKVHYTGTLEDGTVFDSSRNREPLQFTIGQRRLIPGFEQGVVGMEVGETKTIQIPAEHAYGEHQNDLIIEVENSAFPEGMELEVGMRVQGTQPGGRTVDFTVTEVHEESVTLDANHPLAGKSLSFDIELVEIS